MADNMVQHSEAIDSGIAAFARSDNLFEYVVGDAGIGLLQSLKKAPEFRSLRDDIEALPLAVTPGVSRRGRRDWVWLWLWRSVSPIKAASGTVRLRSGRAVIQMSGVTDMPDRGQCSQRPDHQGVVVAVELTPNS